MWEGRRSCKTVPPLLYTRKRPAFPTIRKQFWLAYCNTSLMEAARRLSSITATIAFFMFVERSWENRRRIVNAGEDLVPCHTELARKNAASGLTPSAGGAISDGGRERHDPPPGRQRHGIENGFRRAPVGRGRSSVS